MANTIRQNIMTAVIAALQDIRITNGYVTDAGAQVFEWLAYSTDATVRPCLIVRDAKDAPEKNEPHVSDRRLTVEIIAQADGTTPAADIRAIIGDVFTAMKKGDTFGGNIYWIEETGNETECLHDEDKIFSSTMTYELYYKTEYLNPYNVRNV